MDSVEINGLDKRDITFHYLNYKIGKFNDPLKNEERPPTGHKLTRVLNQLKICEDECKAAYHALMRVAEDPVRKEEVIVRFTALRMKLQDIRDLSEEKLSEQMLVVNEVPIT